MIREKFSKILDLQSQQLKRLGLYVAVVLLIFSLFLPLMGRELRRRNDNSTSWENTLADSSEAGQGTGESSLEREDVEGDIGVSSPSEGGESIKTSQNPVKEGSSENPPTHRPGQGDPSQSASTEKPKEVPAPGLAQEKVVKTEPISTSNNGVEIKKIIWPVRGEIIRDYGMSYSQTFSDYRYHEGLDIKVKRGTEINTALAGKVVSIDTSKSEGKKVIIDHGLGWQTLYAQLEEVYLKKDQAIKGGEKLGYVGQPGLSEIMEGPHLHFAIMKDGESVNPYDFLP